jgi:hypothetical protein
MMIIIEDLIQKTTMIKVVKILAMTLEICSNFGGQDNVEDFKDYYSQIRDKDI